MRLIPAPCAPSLLLLWFALGAGCPTEVPDGPGPPEWSPAHRLDDVLRVNQLQAEGTHNSYHQFPATTSVQDWQYQHAPLDVQLGEQGVRQFELDAYWNDGGFFEVLHAPVIDANTSCATLVECLQVVRGWSDAHPGHHPVFIWIEPKTAFPLGDGADYVDALHAELRGVWPDRVVTPSQVLGDADDLASAVADPTPTHGWPLLGDARGTVVFVLLGLGPVHAWYTGLPMEDQLLFTNGDVGDPSMAVTKIDDPVADEDRIRAAVEAGIVIRTRADGGLVEPMAEDTSRLEAALRSGAHSISTDIPGPDERFDYFVQMPEGTPSRCNPVTAPADCLATDIEDPTLLAP